MRTTVTLDEDVAAKLRAVARERGVSFKTVLNEAVRAALAVKARSSRPYKVPARDLRARPSVPLDKALQLAAELEDDELRRRLDAGT